MSRMLRPTLLLIALVSVTRIAAAQPAVGAEFRVNTHTTSDQYNSAVAADADGNFVVVWVSLYQDGDNSGIFGQRFDRLGNPRGNEFAVNTFTTAYQVGPAVAAHSSGNFVVVWSGGGHEDGDKTGVFARRYDASGAAQGAAFQVNTFVTDYQYGPDVAYQPSGEFVVVWQSYGALDGDGTGIFGQRFDTVGGMLGPEFQVNTVTTGYQTQAAVATTPAGGFVVVWSDDGQDGSSLGVFGQRFNAVGTAVGGEFRVNTYTPGDQADPDVAVDGAGNFVVVWNSVDQDGSSYGVFGQRFDAAGNASGPEFRVNTSTMDRQERPSVTREADGHFVVTWTTTVGLGEDVFGQRFDPNGVKVGLEFRVNTYTTSLQQTSAVASLGAEKFVVTWTSIAQDGEHGGIYAQLFGDLIFRDGFDSGP